MTTLSIEFCQLELPKDSNISFQELVETALELQGEDRAFEVNDAYIRLQQGSVENNFISGELIRLRKRDYQDVIGAPDGSFEHIQLSGSQRMGMLTAFLFHKRTNTLLIHRTRAGVLVPSVAKYFQSVGSLSQAISAYPLIKSSTVADMKKMKTVKRFNFRIAGMTNPGLVFSGDDEAVNTVRKMSSILKAPVLEMSVHVGRFKKESLDKDRVAGLAKVFSTFQKRSDADGQRVGPEIIQIYGIDEDESSLLVDLLKDRIHENINISIGEPRPLTYTERLDALKKAWVKRKDEIVSKYEIED